MGKKICTLRKSKVNPNVFSKDDLFEKVVKKGVKRSDARKMSKEHMCNFLNIEYIKPVKYISLKPKIAKTKKKTVAPKKTTLKKTAKPKGKKTVKKPSSKTTKAKAAKPKKNSLLVNSNDELKKKKKIIKKKKSSLVKVTKKVAKKVVKKKKSTKKPSVIKVKTIEPPALKSYPPRGKKKAVKSKSKGKKKNSLLISDSPDESPKKKKVTKSKIKTKSSSPPPKKKKAVKSKSKNGNNSLLISDSPSPSLKKKKAVKSKLKKGKNSLLISDSPESPKKKKVAKSKSKKGKNSLLISDSPEESPKKKKSTKSKPKGKGKNSLLINDSTSSSSSPSPKKKNSLLISDSQETIEDDDVLILSSSPFPLKVKTPSPKIKSKSPPNSEYSCISNSKLKLQPHQIGVVEHMINHRGLLAWHSVGSGKTLTAVTTSQCVLKEKLAKGEKWRVVVITPVSLVENFQKELEAYGASRKDPRYKFYTIEGFDIAVKSGEENCDDHTLLILDEAHNLRTVTTGEKAKSKAAENNKEIKIKRSDTLIEQCKRAGKVLLLTATPLYNGPYDFVNLVAMVKGVDPISKSSFEKLIEEEDAFRKFFKCTLSYYSKPIDANYPIMNEKVIEIDMGDKKNYGDEKTREYMEEYIEVEQGLKLDMKNPGTFLNGFRRAANGMKISLKAEWIMRKINENLGPNAKIKRKTLIYSAFKKSGINIVKSRLDALDYKYVEVNGDIKPEQRKKNVDIYNDKNNDVNIILITSAGAEGLDLKETRDVIIMENAWNQATDDQVIGRANRYKSHINLPPEEQTVTVYNLVLVKPIIKPTINYKKMSDKPTADKVLQALVAKKTIENNKFSNRVLQLSIEHNSGECQHYKQIKSLVELGLTDKSPPKVKKQKFKGTVNLDMQSVYIKVKDISVKSILIRATKGFYHVKDLFDKKMKLYKNFKNINSDLVTPMDDFRIPKTPFYVMIDDENNRNYLESELKKINNENNNKLYNKLFIQENDLSVTYLNIL
jgi:SNF2 family DNA or RNA helicase